MCQVFQPFECDLRPWDGGKFAQCTAKKRIIMIGDSLMRQQFQSLACLTGNVTVRQHSKISCSGHLRAGSSLQGLVSVQAVPITVCVIGDGQWQYRQGAALARDTNKHRAANIYMSGTPALTGEGRAPQLG